MEEEKQSNTKLKRLSIQRKISKKVDKTIYKALLLNI